MKPFGDDSGAALLMTVSIVTILIAGTLEWNRRARRHLIYTSGIRDRIALTHMASSAVHLGMAVLVADRLQSETDSIQEPWADTGQLNRISSGLAFPGGRIRLKISDEIGKIQVNAIVGFPDRNRPNDIQIDLWERFLAHRIRADEALEGVEPMSIIHAVKDWIDSADDDAVTGLNGAESDHYRELDRPYGCRNGPMPDLSDLERVKGLSRELLYGSETSPGITDWITVHGIVPYKGRGFAYPGRVNVGTAALPVLVALLPPGMEDLAHVIAQFREERSGVGYANEISDSKWYRRVPGYSLIRGKKRSVLESLVSTCSSVFRIEAAAELGEKEFVSDVVVSRIRDKESGKWKCAVLSWQNR